MHVDLITNQFMYHVYTKTQKSSHVFFLMLFQWMFPSTAVNGKRLFIFRRPVLIPFTASFQLTSKSPYTSATACLKAWRLRGEMAIMFFFCFRRHSFHTAPAFCKWFVSATSQSFVLNRHLQKCHTSLVVLFWSQHYLERRTCPLAFQFQW